MFPLFKAGTQAAGLTKVSGWEKINLRPAFAGHPAECGPVAQLGARFHGMEEVVGSIPTRSTNFFNHLECLADAVPAILGVHPRRHHLSTVLDLQGTL